MKKKILAIMLAVVMVLLTACAGSGAKEEDKDDVKIFGATESADPLRICIDLQNFGTSNINNVYNAVNDFLISLEQTGGLQDVVVEYVPGYYGSDGTPADDPSRMAAIDRLRVEIMSGGGPDVFIMTYMVYPGGMGYEYDRTDVLFKYPQKAMENGIFLPLDEYMENNTRFTEWDKQTQAVLAAGRNEEGQQIIPLSYTLPVLCLPQTEFTYTPDRTLYWNDMLTDPVLSPYALDLANCYTIWNGYDVNGEYGEFGSCEAYLEFVLGTLADYENEELAFTEEELLQRVNEILIMDQTEGFKEIDGAVELQIGTSMSYRYWPFGTSMTMIPLYSDDGGITAHIQNFAAVNRNTDRPEDAYTVIDLLMSAKVQQEKPIYSHLLYNMGGIPLNEELFQEDTPLGRWDYLTEENYQELCELRGQITSANFKSELTYMLNDVLWECGYQEYSEAELKVIIHKAYEDMQRRVRE